jgi:hypothetical protein
MIITFIIFQKHGGEMKLRSQNPVYPRFKHLLSSNGRYPAKHVDIFWNRDDDQRITDVEVVFIPRAALRDEELQAEYAQYNKRWTSDLGNSTEHWLEEHGYTPEDIFGHLLRHGFRSEKVTQVALREFAHIEECEWARLMLRGFA